MGQAILVLVILTVATVYVVKWWLEEKTWGRFLLAAGMTAILIILCSFFLLSFTSYHGRSDARRTQCLNNLKQIGLALAMYAEQNNGALPARDGLQGVLGLTSFLGNIRKVGICPADKIRRHASEEEPMTEGSFSYVYRAGLVWDGTNADKTPVCWDKAGNHPHGLIVLFTDGHVQWVTATQWAEIRPHIP